MSKSLNLKPERVFQYFQDLCAIPHGSGNTEGVSGYCMEFARAHGLEAWQDEAFNVVIVKEASKCAHGDSAGPSGYGLRERGRQSH